MKILNEQQLRSAAQAGVVDKESAKPVRSRPKKKPQPPDKLDKLLAAVEKLATSIGSVSERPAEANANDSGETHKLLKLIADSVNSLRKSRPPQPKRQYQLTVHRGANGLIKAMTVKQE